MSVPVGLESLREQVGRFGDRPYLVTVGDDLRPHAVAGPVWWDGDVLVSGAGRRTAANATARPLISLVYAPYEPGGYSLIVDGTARIEGEGDEARVRIEPTSAVLHRTQPLPAPAPEGACGMDCVPVLKS